MPRSYTRKATVPTPVEVVEVAPVVVPTETVITVQFQCKSDLATHRSLENNVLLGKYIDTQEGGLVLVATDGSEALGEEDLEPGVTSISVSLGVGSVRALEFEWNKMDHKTTQSTRVFLRIRTNAGVTVGQKHVSVQGEITSMLAPYALPITLEEAKARIKANNGVNRAGRDEARAKRNNASLANVALAGGVPAATTVALDEVY